MQLILSLLLATAALHASPVNPLILSNFRSSVVTDTGNQYSGYPYSSSSYGFYDHVRVCDPSIFDIGCDQQPAPAIQVLLDVDLSASLWADHTAAHFIDATASVDFSAPGYVVTRAAIFGRVQGGSFSVGADAGMDAPCYANIWEGYVMSSCGTTGLETRTVSAFTHIYSDVVPPNHADNGRTAVYMISLTLQPVAVPEPGTGLLMLVVLLLAAGWSRSICLRVR